MEIPRPSSSCSKIAVALKSTDAHRGSVLIKVATPPFKEFVCMFAGEFMGAPQFGLGETARLRKRDGAEPKLRFAGAFADVDVGRLSILQAEEREAKALGEKQSGH
jgi:hypothetical protein